MPALLIDLDDPDAASAAHTLDRFREVGLPQLAGGALGTGPLPLAPAGYAPEREFLHLMQLPLLYW